MFLVGKKAVLSMFIIERCSCAGTTVRLTVIKHIKNPLTEQYVGFKFRIYLLVDC